MTLGREDSLYKVQKVTNKNIKNGKCDYIIIRTAVHKSSL